MRCPRCERLVAPHDWGCGVCGFSLADVDALYGADFVHMDRLLDSVHCLTGISRRAILARLDRFEAMFPQLFFAVYIDALPEGTSLREFGFWLLNRGAVGSVDFSRPNENGVLLVLDLNSRGASLSIGYGLERVLGQKVLERSLASAGAAWARADYSGGIIRCIDEVTGRLKKRGSRSGGVEYVAAGLPAGLRGIREGHHSGGGNLIDRPSEGWGQ